MAATSEKVRTIYPESRPAMLAKLDGRTREAALMRRTRAELTAHVGGQPSATQRALIERAVNLTVRLALMDAKFAVGAGQSDHDSRTYLSWSNALTKTMRQLGLQPAPKPAKTLAEHLSTPPSADRAAA